MRIFGTICEAGSGRAIENLIIRAYNRDILFDEPHGFATSRVDGSFEILTCSPSSSLIGRSPSASHSFLPLTSELPAYNYAGIAGHRTARVILTIYLVMKQVGRQT